MSALRPLLLATSSAVLASGVTWLIVHPSPPGGDPGRAARSAAASGRMVGSPAKLPPSGSQDSPVKPPDRWKDLRDPHGRITAEAMPAAVAAMLLERDPLQAMEAFSALLRELTPDNAAAAWEAMSGRVHGAEAFRYLPLLAHAWGALDGPGALAVIKSGGDRDGLKARLSVMGGWATRDSGGALAWLKELETNADGLKEGKPEAMQELRLLKAGLIRGLAAHDPNQAMGLLPGMEEKERGPMVSLIAREQFRLGIDAATQWAGAISDPALREQAMASLVRQYAADDPAKAAAWLTAQNGTASNPSSIGAVAREWAAKDPAATVQWMDGLPEGPAKNEAWEDALRSWSKKDPLASSTYLSQMPKGAARDSAVSSLSRSIAREDPDAAIQWANTIQDPAARETALVRSIQLWSTRDKAAAAEWIGSSGLQPEVQQRMLEPLVRREPNPLKKKPDQKPGKRQRSR
ncbi:MAG: hypothetical protein V4675_14725 [Verrucomicrobiota bacterium]